MSQLLFDASSNSTNYVPYDQTTIFNDDFTVNDSLVEIQGMPYLTGTYIAYFITSNAGLTATLVHMFLWNYNEIKGGWDWINMNVPKVALKPSSYIFWKKHGAHTPEEKQKVLENPLLDPHYKVMVDYDEAPTSWYFVAFAASWIVGIVCLYVMKSTLPWWGFIIATIFTFVFMIFFGAQYAITGFGFNDDHISSPITLKKNGIY